MAFPSPLAHNERGDHAQAFATRFHAVSTDSGAGVDPHPHRVAASRGPKGPRSGGTDAVDEQPQATRHRRTQLHRDKRRLPAGVDDNHFSATAKLLPYIDQNNVYQKIDFKKSIDDKANAKARAVRIKTLENPRD